MYIEKDQDQFRLSGEKTPGSMAFIACPVIVEAGAEFILNPAGGNALATGARYSGGGLTVADEYADLGGGLFSVVRTMQNDGVEPRRVKLMLEAGTCYVPKKYLIPCINYSGNQWGDGLEPKGLTCEGEPWVFAYDRVGIPSCSITETGDVALSLFASNRDAASLRSSCSLLRTADGTFRQRIIWPVTEAPFTYSDNDTMVERYEEYMTLEAGGTFQAQGYLLASVPRWENYGIVATLDRALEIFPFDKQASLPPDEIWRLGIAFSRILIQDCRGQKMISAGLSPDPVSGEFICRNTSEIGWAGQSLLCCRMFILEFIRSGDRQLLEDAIEIVGNWTAKQADNGLLLAHYEWYTNGREWHYVPRDHSMPYIAWRDTIKRYGWLPETCNMGWAAAEMIKIHALLKGIGIDKPEFREFALRIGDFFVAHYSEDFAFGKSWTFEGDCEDKQGSIGGFVTMALIELYKIAGDQRYLECARKSLDFYFARDLNNFVCTAGAIDCSCVDKETSGPFVIAALDLYEITGDKKHLEYAEKAAYYFCSWLFHYDALYGPEAEFPQYGYTTTGGTSVSTQHPALDPWGELMCPEFLRLYKITGDEKWRTRARMIWYNGIQCITTDEDALVHGRKRPLGAQNEAFYHCRWGHRKDCNERGHLNDWLVSWVTQFRLTALDRLTSVCGDQDWQALA